MTNIYGLVNRRFPRETRRCLEKMLAHVDDPDKPIHGLAFVAFIDDTGFIADACGKARERPEETRELLRSLDAKLKRWSK